MTFTTRKAHTWHNRGRHASSNYWDQLDPSTYVSLTRMNLVQSSPPNSTLVACTLMVMLPSSSSRVQSRKSVWVGGSTGNWAATTQNTWHCLLWACPVEAMANNRASRKRERVFLQYFKSSLASIFLWPVDFEAVLTNYQFVTHPYNFPSSSVHSLPFSCFFN